MRRRQKKVIVKCGIGIVLIVSLIVFIEMTLNNGIISYNRQFIGTTQYKEAEKADVTKVTHTNHKVNLVRQQTSVLSKVNYFSQTQLLTETKKYIQNEGNLKNSNVNDGKLTDSRQKTEILVTDSTQKLMISTDKQNGGNLSTDSTPQKGNKSTNSIPNEGNVSTNSIPNEGNLKDTSQNVSTKIFVSKHYSKHKNDTDILQNCIPKVDASDIKTPFKFFIYNLPSKFNHDIQRQFSDGRDSFCYNLDYCGMGQELFQTQSYGEDDIIQSVRNTHQFALEVIIHYKLMHSPYRTKDPKKADMFYIPAYTGLRCLQFKPDNKQFINDLFIHLETHEKDYFTSGKPHFSTLSKIQREQASDNCPTLRHPATKNITFFTIEKEANPGWARNPQIQGTSVIVAPYPAYGHFIINDQQDSSLYETRNGLKNLTQSKFRLPVPPLSKRNLTLFLAAGTRRSNGFRNILLDQFKNKTSLAPDKFYAAVANNGFLRQLMLITKECATDHRTATIPWMQQSVFCLQPPGDSPTRKSIYDSILSGCIPVFFTNRHMPEYPFQKYLNYTTFTYTIDEKLISRYNKNVYEILVQLPAEKVKALHNNLLRVAKWFQYSLPNGDLQQDDDAMTLLLHQLTHLYQLPSLPYKAV